MRPPAAEACRRTPASAVRARTISQIWSPAYTFSSTVRMSSSAGPPGLHSSSMVVSSNLTHAGSNPYSRQNSKNLPPAGSSNNSTIRRLPPSVVITRTSSTRSPRSTISTYKLSVMICGVSPATHSNTRRSDLSPIEHPQSLVGLSLPQQRLKTSLRTFTRLSSNSSLAFQHFNTSSTVVT